MDHNSGKLEANMAENRRYNESKKTRHFLVILCFVTVVIIALICVVIFLGVKASNCDGTYDIWI